ncbi:sphingoid long-chain base transporter RSB1 [Corynascus novoguineensis]|uniref:Sphingoid long-chain base transporter RSB1 n=1 Tax=Corynascus novoguineensis TaxID=1126955 RepID=A0AAN7D0T4_9PEZI|nr:sphingoid long-chain base transporter RSB1 [Corynascus novoguineensis]
MGSSCPTGTPDWSGVTLENFNRTLLINPRLCTPCTCPLEIDGLKIGVMTYYPSIGGNAFLTVVFALCLLTQIFLGIRHKTWGFLISMTGGLFLEVLGYIARILMHNNMFSDSYFIMYLVCLTIAPAFLAAGIYLSLSRLIVIYAPDHARFRPQVYTYIFIVFDLIALILQAAGGAVASSVPFDSPSLQSGINTMVAGVAWQVVALVLFGLLSFEFWMRVRKIVRAPSRGADGGAVLNPAFAALRAKRAFQPGFICALLGAGVFIFVRSVFRCAELSKGFDSPLANDEVTFMVLEGTMIALACILLTVFHPGLVVGSEMWSAASWKKGGHALVNDAEKAGTESGSDREWRLDELRA